MKTNKLAILLIFVFLLLATIAYAKSFTDVMGESFARINDFFRNENYKPYSLIIDFFVFSVVFMAIYMRGVKFAFKEVTKTEKALAVILGLATAFLLVIGGYSISKLLPFLPWFLFFFLFVLIWWLLKDMKSKGWRFLLALLLTLLLLLIFFTLFSATSYRISCPESALPWLPWLLALLLFILFWFLLKDIKNAFGRFLFALLLTIAVVLLILFLLKFFAKDLGCPEGPFATSLLSDVGDNFKRMDISTFSGIGSTFTGSSLPTLPQVDAPDKKKEEAGKTVSEIPRPYKILTDAELKNRLQDPSIKPKIEEEIKLREQERRDKAAFSAGLLFGIPKREGMTVEQYEQEILKKKDERKPIGKRKFYPEKEGDKVVIKEDKWLWPDSEVDPNKDDEVQRFINDELLKQQAEKIKQQQVPAQGVTRPGTTAPGTAPPAQGTPSPGNPPEERKGGPPAGKSPTSFLQDDGFGNQIAFAGMGFTILLFLARLGYRRFKESRKKGEGEKTVAEILAKIQSAIKQKEDYLANMNEILRERIRLRDAAEVLGGYMVRIESGQGLAFLLEEPNQARFVELERDENLLLRLEHRLIHFTRNFGIFEADLLKRLKSWPGILWNKGEQEMNYLVTLIEFPERGENESILKQILDLFEASAKDIEEEKDIINLLSNKEKVVTKRFDMLKRKIRELNEFLIEEERKIVRLLRDVREQLLLLERLKQKIEVQVSEGDKLLDTNLGPELQISNLFKYLDSLRFSILSSSVPSQSLTDESNVIERLINDWKTVSEMFRNPRRASQIETWHPWSVDVTFLSTVGTGAIGHFDFINRVIELIVKSAREVEKSLKQKGVEIIERKAPGMRINLAPKAQPPSKEEVERRMKSRRKFLGRVVVGAGLAAIAGGAGLTIFSVSKLLGPSPSPPPPKPIPLPPAARRAAIRNLELTSEPAITGKNIVIQFYITDTQIQNAIYNVTGYLSPPGTDVYLELDTHRINANTPFNKVFSAEKSKDNKLIQDDTYNLILVGLTIDEAGKEVVIRSQFTKVNLGKTQKTEGGIKILEAGFDRDEKTTFVKFVINDNNKKLYKIVYFLGALDHKQDSNKRIYGAFGKLRPNEIHTQYLPTKEEFPSGRYNLTIIVGYEDEYKWPFKSETVMIELK